MATKNMSRTVIEGGRAGRNQFERYQSNKTHRTHNRDFVYKAQSLVDSDDAAVTPKRKKVGKDFDDKLGPMFRWLHKQIGRKWDRVFSDLVQKFDTRTTAGRHVVFSHLLSSVTLQPTDVMHLQEFSYRFRSYYVDEKGALQVKPPRKRHRDHYPHKARKIQDWAACRRVMDYGMSLFWMVPERIEWTKCGHSVNGKYWYGGCGTNCEHRYLTEKVKVLDISKLLAFEKRNLPQEQVIIEGERVTVYYREQRVRECQQGKGQFKQGARLSAADLAIWNSLDKDMKYYLLWMKPELKKMR